MFGINLNGLIPLRSEANEGSEQLTQILFGEYFTVDEVIERWVHIHNTRDNETGWIDRKMMTPIDEAQFNALADHKPRIVAKPIAYATLSNGSQQPLPGGSLLPFYDKEQQQFSIGSRTFKFALDDTNANKTESDFVDTALTYLHEIRSRSPVQIHRQSLHLQGNIEIYFVPASHSICCSTPSGQSACH